MSRTIVCFHAHPDDEALLMGGTMARLSAEGHRVVLVTATGGEAGLAATAVKATMPLGERRLRELAASAAALGCARVAVLGYGDSGMADQPTHHPNAFSQLDVDVGAHRLAQVLQEERADVLTIYDPAGGYGHPDHVQVHRVGRRAAQLNATPLVLEATIDRRALQRVLRRIRLLTLRSPDLDPARFNALFADPRRITHEIDVSRYLPQKRAAMQAHVSQTTADDGTRLLGMLLRLPAPLFRMVLHREWFVEHGRTPQKPPADDILASFNQADGRRADS